MIPQHIRIIAGDAGFEPGISVYVPDDAIAKLYVTYSKVLSNMVENVVI